jgi:hypothetical protein
MGATNGQIIAGDEIHMIGLNQLFGLLLADVRLLLVVLIDHLPGYSGRGTGMQEMINSDLQ